MNSKLSLPSFRSFACKEGTLSSQQTTALVLSAVFKSIACTRAVGLVGGWPAVRYAPTMQAFPQQRWATCGHRSGKRHRDHRVSLGAWGSGTAIENRERGIQPSLPPKQKGFFAAQ